MNQNASIPGIVISLIHKIVRSKQPSLAAHRALEVPITIAGDEQLVPELAGLVRFFNEHVHGDAILASYRRLGCSAPTTGKV